MANPIRFDPIQLDMVQRVSEPGNWIDIHLGMN